MIYIQSDSKKPIPHHFDCACVMYGAIESKMDYLLISYEELITGDYDKHIKHNLFVGSVEFMREVFRRIGLSNVRLPKNSNRDSKIITLGEALDSSYPIFIKPIEIKLFTGLILDGSKYSCLDDLDLETKVLSYKLFESPIESEWRVYILNNEILDSRNYSGDFLISPDYLYVKDIILENKNEFPKSYTIDIGILENKQNVVIEYNDMWSIGNYGVPNYFYIKSLKERYFQIVR